MNEGWVDPRKYLLAVRSKAESLGVQYIKGQVVEFESASLRETGYNPVRRLKRGLVRRLNYLEIFFVLFYLFSFYSQLNFRSTHLMGNYYQ